MEVEGLEIQKQKLIETYKTNSLNLNLRMVEFKTEQEKFWAGEFGDDYVLRNNGLDLIAANTALFARALRTCGHISSVIEFGCNVGLNLISLQNLYPSQKQAGIEINQKAILQLKKNLKECEIYEESILNFKPEILNIKYDLVLIKGVLIHLNPDILRTVYENLVKTTKKYLLICEYYNPTPVSITYRGHDERLYKRDFAGEVLDQFPQLFLVDYGFVYRRDPAFPQDDVTWFLLSK